MSGARGHDGRPLSGMVASGGSVSILAIFPKSARANAYIAIQRWLPQRLKRHVLFFRYFGRWGRFKNPRTYNEKLNWRILSDRRPELAWTCDKLQMKRRAQLAGVPSPTTYWVDDDIASLAKATLPNHWVLKPNHRTGLIYFGNGKPDIDRLREITTGWIEEMQSHLLGEWAYSKARRCLFVEQRLEATRTPSDYKFYVMSGQTVLIQVDSDRFGNHRRNMYTPQWQPIDFDYHSLKGNEVPPPKKLSELKSAAERIAGDLDFLRVDLYLVGDQIYFGEVAAYSGSGLDRCRFYAYDLQLGSQWRLPHCSE